MKKYERIYWRLIVQLIVIVAVSLSLCSCATANFERPVSSGPVSFNASAGRGDWIKVKLHLENGKEIGPVMVDTGWPYKTVLDKSLAPFLGKRIGSGMFYSPFMGGFVRADIYETPKLYLGATLLRMGSRVYVCDLQKEEAGLMGILGMDCLRHYCIQFDFSRNQMRFLDPGVPVTNNFGRAIRLHIIDGLVVARSDCFGTGKVFFCPDTGCHKCDAMLKPKLFRRMEQEKKMSWLTSFPVPGKRPVKFAGFSNGHFDGKSYDDLTIAQWYGSWPGGNLLGLPFLARHRVTFDFPKRTMYLEKQNRGPRNPALFAAEEAGTYLLELKKNGQLPGWATNDFGEGNAPDAPGYVTNYPVSLTFNVRKEIVPGCVDVTAAVKILLAGGTRQIAAGNALTGFDPAPTRLKQLRIVLQGNKHKQIFEIPAGRTLTLPANAQVLQARYGVLSGPVFKRAGNMPGFYHYVLVENAPDGPWKLSKAWQSDVEGRLIKNYSLQ